MRNWLDAFEQEVPGLDEETRRTAEHMIHEAFEDLIADSAEQYLEEQEKSVSHLNSQLVDAVAEIREHESAVAANEAKPGS